MGYVPPQLRNKVNYKPKNLARKVVIDYTNIKPKEQLYVEYRKKNEGKSDSAWNETSYKNVIHYDCKNGQTID
jgi:hypothetical protein